MTAPILVTGGTGTLGRLVVRRLREAGRQVRVLSRRDHADAGGVQFVTGDLANRAGIEQAVDGVGTIVHCASSRTGDADATANLVRAALSRAGTPHLVYVSIVGVDRLPFSYYRSKLDSERVVTESGLPWTILRATQFYDLILTGARRLRRPAGRRRRGSRQARRTGTHRAGRASLRPRRAAAAQLRRHPPDLPAGPPPAASGPVGLDPRTEQGPRWRAPARLPHGSQT